MDEKQIRINPQYVVGQLSKAFTTGAEHPDEATRERAAKKASRWMQVLEGVIKGVLDIGSRTPVLGTPSWVTLKVMLGGFATGEMLAGGELQPHERELLKKLPEITDGRERTALNSYYLSEEGLDELRAMLSNKKYRVHLPEEAALLVVAWLVDNGHAEAAGRVLDQITPWFAKLRFYPIPSETALQSGSTVHVRNVSQLQTDLNNIHVPESLAKQREALRVWAPLSDRFVSLWMKTVVDGWPCQTYPEHWHAEAKQLLLDYEAARSQHRLCTKPDRAGGSLWVMRTILQALLTDATKITGRDVGLLRRVLNGIQTKRGLPGSERCHRIRNHQARQVRRPTATELVPVVQKRLEAFDGEQGIAEPAAVLRPITQDETRAFGLDAGSEFFPSIKGKVVRCLEAPLEELVDSGIIGSAEVLAQVSPQVTCNIVSQEIADEQLRHVYALIYRAFRRRRSVLLLNLQHQVTIDELPWVQAIPFLNTDTAKKAALATAKEIVALELRQFPEQIVPNKMLQELNALFHAADVQVPLVDEIAADIFTGEFSEKFLIAAKCAMRMLRGTLYERYYALDAERVLEINDTSRTLFGTKISKEFSRMCHDLAAEDDGTSATVAGNGKVIERQQVLTTQNLAVLFDNLELANALNRDLQPMSRRCFSWICESLLTMPADKHARLTRVKQCAYAWRQMIFYLSLLSRSEVDDFLLWAELELVALPRSLRVQLEPALNRLKVAHRSSERQAIVGAGRIFWGWCTGPHFLLASREEAN